MFFFNTLFYPLIKNKKIKMNQKDPSKNLQFRKLNIQDNTYYIFINEEKTVIEREVGISDLDKY